jgi:phosphatidylinositol glycan class B
MGRIAALILLLAAVPRLWLVWGDQGIFWPDEIYQSLEPANLFAFGYGTRVWEFTEGARSWLFAGTLGLLWKFMALLGADSGKSLVIAARLLMALASIAAVDGAMRLAAHFGGRAAGWLAGLLAAGCPLLLMFASRCMPETLAGALIGYAALALVRRGRHDAWLAGALCGIAVFLRYPSGLVLLGFLGWLAAARRFDELRHYALAALAVGWCGGVLDWITWGEPFQSLRVYVEYNVANQAELYGSAPPWFYATTAWTALGPALAALVLGWAGVPKPARPLLFIALAFCAVHSLSAHKELRFLLPVAPLLLALAATGLVRVIAALRLSPRVAPLVGVGICAAFAQRSAAATFGDFGQYLGEPAAAMSPWRAGDGANRLIWLAGEQPDLCGLWVVGVRPIWVAGAAHLHRDVPLLKGDFASGAHYANYALEPLTPLPYPLSVEPAARIPAEFSPYARSRGWLLLRREGDCAAVTW